MIRRLAKKTSKEGMVRNIFNVTAITLIATTAITWIGIMELKKKR